MPPAPNDPVQELVALGKLLLAKTTHEQDDTNLTVDCVPTKPISDFPKLGQRVLNHVSEALSVVLLQH